MISPYPSDLSKRSHKAPLSFCSVDNLLLSSIATLDSWVHNKRWNFHWSGRYLLTTVYFQCRYSFLITVKRGEGIGGEKSFCLFRCEGTVTSWDTEIMPSVCM